MQKRRVAVRGIVFHDGKLLVTKFKMDEGGETEYWATFGGGLDLGESLHEGLHREMIEETGVEPKIGKLLFMQQFRHGEREHLEFFFHIENGHDYQAIDLSATSHGHLELARHDFIEAKGAYIFPDFLSQLDLEKYVKEDMPVYIHNELR